MLAFAVAQIAAWKAVAAFAVAGAVAWGVGEVDVALLLLNWRAGRRAARHGLDYVRALATVEAEEVVPPGVNYTAQVRPDGEGVRVVAVYVDAEDALVEVELPATTRAARRAPHGVEHAPARE